MAFAEPSHTNAVHHPPKRRRLRSPAYASTAVTFLPLILAGCELLAPAPATPSVGTMPPAPIGGGQVGWTRVPDFVAASGPDGSTVGYVAKADLMLPTRIPAPNGPYIGKGPPEPGIPVYGPDLQTIVGHYFAGIGFVGLGEDLTGRTPLPVQLP